LYIFDKYYLPKLINVITNSFVDSLISYAANIYFISFYYAYSGCSSLLIIISAAITPGTQPQRVSKKVIISDPHPLSKTARGGKIIASRTLIIDITVGLL